MAIKTEQLTYEADGLTMIGHLAWDDSVSGQRPGVVVFPEAFGLGDHAKQRAERLASEFGYIALAADLHGDGQVIDDFEKMMPLLMALASNKVAVRDRTNKALEALKTRPEVDPNRIGAIGFCYGGTMSYELALSGADIKAAIGFHSGLQLTSLDDAKDIKGKVLVLIGADDPGIAEEDRLKFQNAMREGGVDWQLHLYGGVVHSFTSPEADKRGQPHYLRYDATADKRSWAQMSALFAEVFA